MAGGGTNHRTGATRRAREAANGQTTGGGNDDIVILQDMELQDDHQAALNNTMEYMIKPKTMRDYCNRLDSMLEWVREHYPEITH